MITPLLLSQLRASQGLFHRSSCAMSQAVGAARIHDVVRATPVRISR